MEKEFSLEDGKELIGLARKSIEYVSASGKKLLEKTEKKRFLEKRGCFVTLNTFPEKELRGCIGFPYPLFPLWNAVIDAAVEAAFNDSRFPRLQASELGKIVVEISVLSAPKEIIEEKDGIAQSVEIEKDGLIVKRGQRSGLLLPQVATEQEWGAEEFLSHCCEKAGLPPATWRQADCHIFKFQAQIFSEKEPKGNIEES